MLYLYNNVEDWKTQYTSSINGGEMGFNPLTCGFIVCFIPVEDNERGTTFHCDHSKVRRSCTGRTGHCGFPSFFLREVAQGRSDGAWLIWFLISFIHYMRSWETKNWICSNIQFWFQHDSVWKWWRKTSGAKLNKILNPSMDNLHLLVH